MTIDLVQMAIFALGGFCFFRAGENHGRKRAGDDACESCYKKGVNRGVQMGVDMVVKKMREAGAHVEVVKIDQEAAPGEDFVKVEDIKGK